MSVTPEDMNGLMLGGDHAIALENGRLLVGGMFSYTHSELDARTSDGKVDSLGLGVYTTGCITAVTMWMAC